MSIIFKKARKENCFPESIRIKRTTLLLKHNDVNRMGKRSVIALESCCRSSVVRIEQGGEQDSQRVLEDREKFAGYELWN